jgi:hypothetical protein
MRHGMSDEQNSYPNWVFDPTKKDPDVVKAEEAAEHAAQLAEFGADVIVTRKHDEDDVKSARECGIELEQLDIWFQPQTSRASNWFGENFEDYWRYCCHLESKLNKDAVANADALIKRLIAAGFVVRETP